MGSSLSAEQVQSLYGVQELKKQDWEKSDSILKRTSSTAKLQKVSEDCEPISTYSSQKHTFLIDQYRIDMVEPLSSQSYLKQIKWRNSCEELVKVKYIKGFQSSSICQGSLNSKFIYTQHIPLRLSQITDIPFPDNLYLLKACLQGFHYIYTEKKCLNIRQDLICLNSQGKIKVWMNSNLSKSIPFLQNIFKLSKPSEISLVNDIINIVDQNTDHQYQPKKFKDFLQQFKLYNLTFAQCLEAVDHFAHLLKVTIPTSLQSVNGLFNPLLNRLSFHQFANGRLVDTNETKMVESIPLQRQNKTNAQFISNSNYINSVDQYICPTNSEPYYNQRIMRTSIGEHTILRPMIKTEQTYLQHYPSSQTLMQGKQQVRSDEEEWRYFDLNGWVEIDRQILLDLKKINVSF